MAVIVTYDGISYSIPEQNEVGWSSLTDYLVALSSGASTKQMLYSVRLITSAPSTLTTTDTVVLINVASPSAITFPAGTSGQFYTVIDTSGAANTNNITITASGGQLLNGAASYVINSVFGAVTFQFDGTNWHILNEYTNVFKNSMYAKPTYSFVESSINYQGTVVSAGSNLSCSASFGGSKSIQFVVAIGDYSILCHTSYTSAKISAISDDGNWFLDSDSGVGFYVTKAANSATITFKNRMGGPRNIEIKALTNILSSQTNWA